MSWVKISDTAREHPKLRRAGAEGFALWVCALCYSNAQGCDGRIAKDILPALYFPLARKADKLASRLCEVGLWHDRGDHYEIHNYEKYQHYSMKAARDARLEHDRSRKKRPAAEHRFPAGIQTESARNPPVTPLARTGRDGISTCKLEVREALAVDAESPASLAALARLKAGAR